MASEELDIRKSGELSAEDAAYMERMAAEARSDIDVKTDVRLPALTLVQAVSKLAGDHKPGSIVHTLTGEEFKTVDVLVATMFKSRVRFGKELGEAPLCTSPNAQDGFGDPGDRLRDAGTVGPRGGGDCTRCPEAVPRTGTCTLRYNYLGKMLGTENEVNETWIEELPVGVTMQRTSVKVASRLNSLLLDAKYPWSNVLTLSTKREENEKGSYFIWNVQRLRPATLDEMMAVAKVAQQMREAQSVAIVGEDAPEPPPDGKDKDIPF